ncbi:uncharacterized protein LOC144432791 [Glandiceps talaboti]
MVVLICHSSILLALSAYFFRRYRMPRSEDHTFILYGRKSWVYLLSIFLMLLITIMTTTGKTPFKYCLSRPISRSNGSHFDCSDMHLQEIPRFLPNTTTELNIYNNLIDQLSNTSFSHLPYLEKLNLSYNNLRNISAASFKNLGKLEELDLSSNFIISIPCGTFKYLKNLKILSIVADATRIFQFEGLYSIFNNSVLEVSNCTLTGLGQLEFLDLRNYILYPYNLTHSCVNLDFLDPLPNLKCLDLSKPLFYECIDTYTRHMSTAHRSLNGKDNTIGLTKLNLAYNKFRDLKASYFSNLHNLENIDFSYNVINSIGSGTFERLRKLTFLDLSYNLMQVLFPDTFQNLSLIRHLNISYNRITFIWNSTFIGLTNLTSLDLTYNPMIYVTALHGLENLHHLKLGGSTSYGSPRNSIVDHTTLTELRSLELVCHKYRVCDNAQILQIHKHSRSIGNWLCNYPNLQSFQTSYSLNRKMINFIDISWGYGELASCMSLSKKLWKRNCNSIETLSLQFPHNKLSNNMPSFFIDLLSDTPIAMLNFSAPIEWMPNCTTNKSIKVETLLYNGYTDTMVNVFSCFDGLKALYLNNSNPPLENINPSTFIGLDGLELLDLSDNKVIHIDGDVFRGLDNLVYLNVSSNALELSLDLQPVLPNLTSLRIIDIGYSSSDAYFDIAYGKKRFEEVYMHGFKELASNPVDICSIPVNTMLLDLSKGYLYSNLWCFQGSTKVFRATGNLMQFNIYDCGLEGLETLDLANTISKLSCLDNIIFPSLTQMIAQILDDCTLDVSVPLLKSLDMSSSKLRLNNHQVTFSNTQLLKYVNLSNTLYDQGSAECNRDNVHVFFQDFFQVENLNISNSGITELCQFYFMNLTSLKILDLSLNKITSVSNDLFEFNSNLTLIDLSHNQIKYLHPSPFKMTSLYALYFENNSLNCDCNIAELQSWMTNNNTLRFTRDGSLVWQTYQCNAPSNMQGKPFTIVDFKELDCEKGLAYVLVLAPTSACIVIVIIGVILWMKRWKLIYRAYRHVANNRQRYPLRYAPLDDKVQVYQYDAFVCYSHKDSKWVYDNLLPTLEDKPPHLNLCIAERDFRGGRYILTNISDAVMTSRKVVFLISNNFVKSRWCERELQHANQHILNDNVKDNKMLFVLLEEVDENDMSELVKFNINTKTFCEWPHSNNRRKIEVFWTKLVNDLTG